MSSITSIKQDHAGEIMRVWETRLLESSPEMVVVEGFFDHEDIVFEGMLLARGDCFIETYYLSRWYNIFEVRSHGEDILRGWYCNISYPAVLTGSTLTWRDLALDLLVFPDGRQVLVDEEEFNTLPITMGIRQMAWKGLASARVDCAQRAEGIHTK